jgi:hypothetical protein
VQTAALPWTIPTHCISAQNNCVLPFRAVSPPISNYGQTGTSAFREVPTFVEYLTYDKSNSQLYIGFNSANTTISPIIDNKTYQSIVRYDGSQFQNVADVDVLDVGMIAPLNNSNILVSPYTTGSNVTATLLQPARTSATNQSTVGLSIPTPP